MRTNKGMTLIEVIIAVVIFAIAATMLANGFVMAARINLKSAAATHTGSELNEQLDVFNAASPGSVTVSPGNVTVNINIGTGSETVIVSGAYVTPEETDDAGVPRSRTRFIPSGGDAE